MDKIFFQIFLVSLFSYSSLSSQSFTDTIYSGRTLEKKLNNSFVDLISSEYHENNFCFENNYDYQHESKKAFVPFILRHISEKTKDQILLDYDVLIYSLLCNSSDYLEDTIYMELHFSNNQKAKKGFNVLEKLRKIREKEDKYDKVPNIGVLNIFFTYKNKVLYFVYSVKEDSNEKPSVSFLKNRIIKILDNVE